MSQKQRSFSDRFWNNKNGEFVVWQRPNPLLWIWIVTVVLGLFLPAGDLAGAVSLIGKIAIVMWGLLEVLWGASYFRRLLGLGVVLLPLVVVLLY